MAVFDQRGQKVAYQYNAAGDINFSLVQNRQDLVIEIEKLLGELHQASQQKVINGRVAGEAAGEIEQAIIEAKKPAADSRSIIRYLAKAKRVMEGVAGTSRVVVGLVSALKEAHDLVVKLFP